MSTGNNRPEVDDDGATILDDGLSMCDEELQQQQQQQPYQQITSAQAAAIRSNAKQYKFFTLFLLFFTFLISVIVATVRYYGNPRMMAQENGNGGGMFDPWGNKLREKENAQRLKMTLDYLIYYDVSDPETLEPEAGFGMLGVSSYSPQYRAALWISQDDKYRISIPSTNEPSREDYPFKQRYALAVLYFATGGAESWIWKMKFLTGLHECNWLDQFANGFDDVFFYGVICDGKPDLPEGEEDLWSGRRTVTGISLPPMNQMLGTLPAEIRHLGYMKLLSIQQNQGLVGSIPFQYGWLKHMSLLSLRFNSLSGKIPREFAHLKNMQYLGLERNQFSANTLQGDLDFMQEMTSLKFLTLDYNAAITGTLPDFLSDLPNLQVLSLSNLGMYGTLPPSLSNLTQLKQLYLDDNAFEGSIDMIQSLTKLTQVYLEDNNFNDTLDDTSFANSKNLVHLDISNCSFGGSVPGHLFNLTQLTVLDMSLNNLEGKLPAEAMFNTQATNLQFLSLHTNNITGPIPMSIGKLKSLRTLDLSINQFSGDLPTEIGELVDLNILFLGKNNFTEAPVREWIRNMTQLTELSLKSSSLNETIPEWLGELTDLTFLDLGENDLTNTIPQSLGNLTKLMVLILNGNRLNGELGLGQLEKLETLLIDDNDLTGNTDAMCAHDITHFIADCAHSIGAFDVELNCTCCTLCCSDENTTCNDAEWLGNHKALWEYGYNRMYWDFEEGIVSPFIDYNNS